MITRASESIETVAREFRDLAALTVCIRPELAAQVKERIHRFREQVTELCDAEPVGVDDGDRRLALLGQQLLA